MYVSDTRHPQQSLADKLQAIYGLSRGHKMDLGFRPAFLKLLEAYKNPQRALPPVIHIAGTNGKGSTLAFLRSILEAAGLRVHSFTSPHLVRFNERIVLAGHEISDSALEGRIDEALRLNNGADITFFELTTALAFAAFRDHPADVALIEVGLGGRLDCTNIIEAPALSIITTLSLDHTEFLGENITDIAAEKGGIIKAGCPVLIGHQNPETLKEVQNCFRHMAERLNAPISFAGADWRIEAPADHMRFENAAHECILPLPALTGPHQVHNAGLAIQAALSFDGPAIITQNHIEHGLRNAVWPARLQKMNAASYDLPAGSEIWLDGGHNEDAGRALALQCLDWSKKDNLPLYVIFGMMQHKNPSAFMAGIAPFADDIYCTDISGEPGAMTGKALSCAINGGRAVTNIHEGFSQIRLKQEGPYRILICGSLYLAGLVLKDAQKPS